MIHELVKKHGIANLLFQQAGLRALRFGIRKTHWYNPYRDTYKVRLDELDHNDRWTNFRSETFYQSDLWGMIRSGQIRLSIRNSGAWVPYGAYWHHQCRKNARATMRKRKKK